MIKSNLLIFENHIELSSKLAQDILLIAEKSISLKDEFTIVLTGIFILVMKDVCLQKTKIGMTI